MKLTKEELKEFEKVFWNIEFRDEDLQYDLFDKNKLDHIIKGFN